MIRKRYEELLLAHNKLRDEMASIRLDAIAEGGDTIVFMCDPVLNEMYDNLNKYDIVMEGVARLDCKRKGDVMVPVKSDKDLFGFCGSIDKIEPVNYELDISYDSEDDVLDDDMGLKFTNCKESYTKNNLPYRVVYPPALPINSYPYYRFFIPCLVPTHLEVTSNSSTPLSSSPV